MGVGPGMEGLVPGLRETLERVVVGPRQQRALEALQGDRTHGAAQLAGWVLDALQGNPLTPLTWTPHCIQSAYLDHAPAKLTATCTTC